MAAQPREEDIQNLLDLTGGAIDRPEAIERLKVRYTSTSHHGTREGS